MAKSINYSSLNPVVVQAPNNLQYRYSGETPEIWYSRVRYPFKKLLEYNPKYFSKNGFIQMIERVYIDGEFKAGRRSFHTLQKLNIFNRYRIDIVKFILTALFRYHFDIKIILI